MTTAQAPALGAAERATSRATRTTSGSLDYDAFLQLLIAQLRNQDPLNPMDSTEYVAQLAALSNVEQAMAHNTKLDRLLVESSLSQADAVIGRQVTSADGSVSGRVASVRLGADGPVAQLQDGRELALGAGVVVGAR
jgi:flagellar basal-body rod modification protein FlgD